jgi:uncharacterized protein (DUF433 family)
VHRLLQPLLVRARTEHKTKGEAAMPAQSHAHLDRIAVDREILAGKPVVRGTRIPVELVLKRLAHDLDVNTLLVAYPRLTPDDVRACIDYARALVEGEEIFPETVQSGRPPASTPVTT